MDLLRKDALLPSIWKLHVNEATHARFFLENTKGGVWGSHDFFVGKYFSKPKNQGCCLVKTLLFSKNLSNLDQPRNLNLICNPFYQANYKVDKVGLLGDIAVY